MKPIKTAVVGVGHLGAIHARIYSQLAAAQLVAVCDTLPERAQILARAYRCRAVLHFSELIGEVEAVSIAVPTQDHFAIAQAFLKAGIHVLLEKPITRTVAEADELLAIARETQAVFQVGHVERFNAALRRVHDLLKNPRFVEVHRLAPFQPRGTEVGVVLDLMIHDLDILLWLVKSKISRVEAVGVKVLTPFEDIANARIVFENGAVADLTASRISKEAMRKFRIFQSDGYFSIDFLSQAVDLFRKEGGQIRHEAIEIPKEEPLASELAAFLESIQNRRAPAVTAQEARDALAAALKVTELIQEGKCHPHESEDL
ncbi:MAG: Gfo/Idh/MocA family oxidoreductase [Candidatus Omnitrophica bacterium]|nr:Gfo/Idh/MocA family oxidoreductase [Candidatus Omnitrophota bacterium]